MGVGLIGRHVAGKAAVATSDRRQRGKVCDMEAMRKRALRALLVGALFAGLTAIALSDTGGALPGAESGFSGRAYGERLVVEAVGVGGGNGSEDAPPVWEAVDRRADEAPAWVEEEIVALRTVGELKATDDWSVLGFTLGEDVAGARSWLAAQLEERGWLLMEAGIEGTATAVKEDGRCTWLLFSCTAVGEDTCVVMQLHVP